MILLVILTQRREAESDPPRRQDRPEDLEAADVHASLVQVAFHKPDAEAGRFPLSSPGRHAIVAAFSCYGIHFSEFLDVTTAGDAGAGRTFHQPVDGVLIEKGMVYVYVQENVRGLDMDRYDDDPLYPTAPPRVVRYVTTLLELERRAIVETRGLAGCSL